MMANATEIINALTKDQIRTDLPELVVGNNVKVYQRIVEGSRTRTQMFEGTIIKKQGGGIAETFTVRRLSYGVGVEKTWPVNSPNIERIEVSRKGKVRRAKLFYLRDRVGKAAKTREQVGARIEDREITVKEEIVEESEASEAPEEAPNIETKEVTVEETVDTVKEEPVEDVKEK